MLTSRQAKAIARYHLGIARHLFIHIPKNAGMAIRNSRDMRRRVIFSDPYFHISKSYTQRLYETMEAAGYHHGAQHARLRDIHPSVRARVQPVSVVRNPWRRTISRFTFQYKYLERAGEPVDYSRRNFEEFLETRHEYAGREFFWHRAIVGWYPQLDYVVDETGEIKCHILRQEHLGDEVDRYFGPVNIPQRNLSGLKAPDPRDLYTERTIQMIGDWYQDDVDAFGFDFDGAATRNAYFLP